MIRVILVKPQKRGELKWKPQSSWKINYEQNVGRNMNSKGHSGSFWAGNECIIGSGRKGHSFYKVAKNLAKLCLCSNVLWKVEL